jgi:hypothetical protein
MASLPSTPQSIRCVPQLDPPVLYRQVDYYDGKNVSIAESRRRQHVTRPAIVKPASAHNAPMVPKVTQIATSMRTNSPPASPNGTTTSIHVARPKSHVTWKARRTNTKAVVVQASVPIKKPNDAWVGSEVHIDDTSASPPRTPKISRLPTPDLDDFGGERFCDCCSEGKVFLFCAWCRHDLDGMERYADRM